MTKSTSEIYELPINERVRLMLRLEEVFAQAEKYESVADRYETKMCLDSLFALLNLTNRYDLRVELLKELERIRTVLTMAKNSENVNLEKIDIYLNTISKKVNILHDIDSRKIEKIRHVEFLNIIKQRNIHDTGNYLFETPELLFWMSQPVKDRQKDMQSWLEGFISYRGAVEFLLNLIRESVEPTDEVAKEGIFLKTMDSKIQNQQLIRVELQDSTKFYPRISGGKYRFAIRFMEQISKEERAKQTEEDVKFKLYTCTV